MQQSLKPPGVQRSIASSPAAISLVILAHVIGGDCCGFRQCLTQNLFQPPTAVLAKSPIMRRTLASPKLANLFKNRSRKFRRGVIRGQFSTRQQAGVVQAWKGSLIFP